MTAVFFVVGGLLLVMGLPLRLWLRVETNNTAGWVRFGLVCGVPVMQRRLAAVLTLTPRLTLCVKGAKEIRYTLRDLRPKQTAAFPGRLAEALYRRRVVDALRVRVLLGTGNAASSALAAGVLKTVLPPAAYRLAGLTDAVVVEANFLREVLCLEGRVDFLANGWMVLAAAAEAAAPGVFSKPVNAQAK